MKMAFRIMRAVALCIFLVEIFIIKYVKAEETYSNPVLVEIINVESVKKGETFLNQLIDTFGIGDPTVIFYESKYYLYPTGDQYSYDVYISSDLVHWNKGPKVFRSVESGAWAPDVFYNPDDKTFYLYYTVNRNIGVASADQPDGNFVDQGILIKGAIDAHMFLDKDDKYYLYYVKYPAFRIYVQPMENPIQKKGKPIQIIQPTEPWEKKPLPLTEAPWMLTHKGIYYLLYSGGGADTQYYAIGYATAKSPVGPFVKYSGNPIVKRGNGVFGPGHSSVTKARNGELWMVYHQQKNASRGWNRIICIDPLWFDDEGILHGKATRAIPQSLPVTIIDGKLYQR
jgi:beta-xylosidase